MLEQINFDKINEILLDKIKPFLIYLFGSAAKGNFREDSDIDIAFISDEKICEIEVFNTAQEIASLLNRDIDLVDLKLASTVLKAQIIGTGKIIFCNDENRKDYFEMKALKEYALLNEEREVILKTIRQRGNIYG